MFKSKNKPKRWSWRKPNRPDDLLNYVGQQLEEKQCTAYQTCMSLTKEESTIKKSSTGRYTYSQIGMSNILTGLHSLETQVSKALEGFLSSSKALLRLKQAQNSEIMLVEREHLEEALPFEEGQREVQKEKVVLVSEKQEKPIFNTKTTSVDASPFSGEPRATRLIRLVIVYATKYALCRLGDKMNNNPLLWRVFPELEEPEHEVLREPIRTNMLHSHSYIKHIILWVCFCMALPSEYIILFHLGKTVLLLSGFETFVFPLFMLVVCKLVAWALERSIRRYVKSQSHLPRVVVAMCITAFVVTLSYGYMVVVKTEETKLESQIKAAKEQLEMQEEELFNADMPTEEMKVEIKKTKTHIQELEDDLYSDPYQSKYVSFIGLGLLSGLVLGANSIILAFLSVAAKAAKYQREFVKAQREVFNSQCKYTNLLSRLHSARRLYLEFERLFWEASAIQQMRHCYPTEAELLESLPLEIKDLEGQYQSILSNKNKES